MSRVMYGGMLATVILASLVVGWFLGEPTAPAPTLVHTSFHSVAAPSPEASAPPGADDAPGWQARNVLRDHLSTAIEHLKETPCDAALRAAFLGAYADRAMAVVNDNQNSSEEQGPAFWRTADDDALGRQIEQLEKEGYTTQEEITLAVVTRRLGPEGVKAQETPEARAAQPELPPRCAGGQTQAQLKARARVQAMTQR